LVSSSFLLLLAIHTILFKFHPIDVSLLEKFMNRPILRREGSKRT
jgi:hypothetical protein